MGFEFLGKSLKKRGMGMGSHLQFLLFMNNVFFTFLSDCRECDIKKKMKMESFFCCNFLYFSNLFCFISK